MMTPLLFGFSRFLWPASLFRGLPPPLSSAFAYSRLARLSPLLSTPSVSARADLPEGGLFSTFLHASGSFLPYRHFLTFPYIFPIARSSHFQPQRISS